MTQRRWEYCVLHIQVVPEDAEHWRWEAQAWVGEESILHKEYTEEVWKQGVIQQLGEMGWELVNVVPSETLMGPKGGIRKSSINQVSVLTLFFKREMELPPPRPTVPGLS